MSTLLSQSDEACEGTMTELITKELCKMLNTAYARGE